jgi:hypothetical protein
VTYPIHVSAVFMLACYGGGLALIAAGFVLWRKTRALAVAAVALGFVLNAVSFDAQSHKLAIEAGRVVHRGGLVPRAPVAVADVRVDGDVVTLGTQQVVLDDGAAFAKAIAKSDL